MDVGTLWIHVLYDRTYGAKTKVQKIKKNLKKILYP